MKPKDIFGLGVRLLGLYFLYSGFNDFALALGSDIFESSSTKDIVYALLPVVFKLIVSLWLMSGGLLSRWAYPDSPKISESLPARPAPSGQPPEPAPVSTVTDMDRAEKKLAALVEKPKDK